MTDPDIRRWLALQTRYSVGHVPAADVFAGAEKITASLEEQHRAGHRHIVVDAIRDQDLVEIGRAAKGLSLITGGSGVALVGRTEGDVIARLQDLLPIIGHIQFASVPDRGTPDHDEIDYRPVFSEVERLGWNAPLGAEYKPQGDTDASLSWMSGLV